MDNNISLKKSVDPSTVDAGTLSMKHMLDNLGPNPISKKSERAEWDKKTRGFCHLFEAYLTSRSAPKIDWDGISTPSSDLIPAYSSLPVPTKEQQRSLAEKLVVVKLNGGLGTSMGCQGPKSCIEVRQHQTFLDLTVKQITYLNRVNECNIPLILMNSFNTDTDTSNIVRKYDAEVKIESFNQNKYPRIYADSLLPLIANYEGQHHEWYPPGHGDVYQSFADSGLLDRYLEEGKEWAFISNIDNLGATVDFTILSQAMEHGSDFVMEVTDKTRADIKGGTLIRTPDHPLKLLEVAQVPKEHMHDFFSIKKFKVFNTNNIWVNLKSLKSILATGNPFKNMDIICNQKVDKGQRIIQLETAAGAAISLFKHAQSVNVPRSRFLPVKSTSDLFVLQSDLFSLENGMFKMSKLRAFPNPPMVKLGPYMKDVASYIKRFGGQTNIIDLDQLTISGDVTVGRQVVLKGTVIIVAAEGDKIDIPDGAILEDKVVTGSLRILDH